MSKGCGPSCGCAKRRQEDKTVNYVARDPVCGKRVDRNNSNSQSIMQPEGEMFFCSTKCMTEYISDPSRYAGKKKGFFSFLGFG
ncbi:YHS domain-containing protein [Pseudodesulfovibrio piezophilus]|uniref:YHS domain-containing protein n=1 Tax=Pseudodesulfovibrio piezophilus TaxID=879567 RepID=UPI0012FF3701|nr:YHS domain-containing protein [Pseudodesulfovibrio piezophilus]